MAHEEAEAVGASLWQAENMAFFETDGHGLPACRLLAQRPFHYPPDTPAPEGMEETDPWFILGNYGLTLFPHASGSYQLFHTERGFARLNHDGSRRVTGRSCRCSVAIDGETADLLECEADVKRFGCGWAVWVYRIGGLEIVRRIDVVPSRSTQDRIPAFRITTSLRNTGEAACRVAYTEGLAARYHFANWNNPPLGRQAARYPVETSEAATHCLATFRPQALRPLVFDEPGRFAQADGQPIQVHLDIVEGNGSCRVEPVDDDSSWLLAEGRYELRPGEEEALGLLVGWSDDSIAWDETRKKMDVALNEMRRLWVEKLPRITEAEPAVRGEMQWHAHTLYAMATWDQRYGCTFIPQGTIYEFGLGVAAVTRDHAMHALPACSYDPELALSVVEYLARHTDLRGQIEHGDDGAGIAPVGGDQKSDNQLFALLLTVEYLERNADTQCLARREPFFPCGCETTGTLLDRIGRWVRFLRDGVYVGKNGMVRIMCSDLSDTLHSAFPHLQYSHSSYHKVFNGESYVNTTMAVDVLRRLGAWLDSSAELLGVQRQLAADVRDACREYEEWLRKTLFADLEGRPWVPRGRVGDEVLGDDDAFAAPQAFAFSNPELPEERRRALWHAVKPRLWDGEHFGVRLREGEGKHRCGMVWYAWTGMFALGLADIEPDAARETLERLSLRRRAAVEPRQWMGLWSNSDVTWAYHGAGPGKIPGTTRVGYVKRFPHFCAHVHAWPLMLWYRLRRE